MRLGGFKTPRICFDWETMGLHSETPLETHTDIISVIISFCPPGDFLFIAGVNKSWASAWLEGARRPKRTLIRQAALTEARTEWVLGEPKFERASEPLGGIFYLAAEAGNLGGLKAAAITYGKSWTAQFIAREVTRKAAEEGHLDVLQWAREQGCPWYEAEICRCAAKGGHLEVLKWARGQSCQWDEHTCMVAAEGGHLEVLKWARGGGCPWDEHTCSCAAMGGHLEVLRWARGQGCPWGEFTCAFAAKGGHLELLQWAREQGCSWDARTCSYAAWGGHLDVLKWLRLEGCPWNDSVCSSAAMGGHLELLRWAREQGCPWDRHLCILLAATDTDLTQWVHTQPD